MFARLHGLKLGSLLLAVGLVAAGCDDGHHRPAATPTATVPGSGTATSTPTGGTAATPTATPVVTPTSDLSCATGPVTTTVGEVCGTNVSVGSATVRAFLGIPYGEDTGGANRWQPPTPKAASTTRIHATAFGPICPEVPETTGLPPQSEDCLSVNVWSPAGAAPGADLPVMVFIYGGSFETGTSAVPLYDGSYMSSTQNAVVVTFNYRVGALGFLHTGAPEAANLGAVQMRNTYAEAEAYCEERRAFLLVDIPPATDDLDAMQTWLNDNAGLRHRNAAVYFPRVMTADPLNQGRLRAFGASGTMAGVYAQTDATRGVWKAPAGTDARLRNVQDLAYVLTDRENGALNPLGANSLRNFPIFGNVAWGARTLDGADQ